MRRHLLLLHVLLRLVLRALLLLMCLLLCLLLLPELEVVLSQLLLRVLLKKGDTRRNGGRENNRWAGESESARMEVITPCPSLCAS